MQGVLISGMSLYHSLGGGGVLLKSLSLIILWCISDNDINGEAFMDLEDSDLVEMGFTKKGQRMKIVKIIQSIKVRKSIEYYMEEFYGIHYTGK